MTEVEKQANNNNNNTSKTDAAEPQANGTPAKKVIVKGVTGTVKWFNVKNGYGFISRNDKENEDVFVHQTAIARNNPNKAVRSVGDGETVEFDIVEGEKGNEAANVTGVGGEPVKGSQYAAEKRFYGNRRRGGGYMRGRRDGRRPRLSRRDNYNTEEPGSAQDSGVEKIEQETPERPRRVNRRPYLRRYYRGPRGGGPPRGPRNSSQNNGENYNNEERGENNEIVNYGGDRPQGAGGQEGAPRRRQKPFTRRFWSRRPRRPRSDTEGSQSGADGDASGNDNAVNNQENREPRQRRQRRQGGGSAGAGGGGFRVRRRGLGRRGPPRGSRGDRNNRDGSAREEKQEGKSDRKVGDVNSIGKDRAKLEDKEETVSDSTVLVEKNEEVQSVKDAQETQKPKSLENAKTSLPEQEGATSDSSAPARESVSASG